MCLSINIYSEKQLKDILVLFNYITFEKTISNESIFLSDRTTNMQCSRMQNKIYGSVVTLQYHVKCDNPCYQKSQAKNLR